jgi:single-strand DNA-binding protein
MNKYINKIQISGHLGSVVSLSTLDNGRSKARFSVATTDVFSDKIQRTQWHDIVAWDCEARYCYIHLKRGDWVTLEGRLNYRTYEDHDGFTRYIAEVVVTKIKKQ